MDNAGVRKGSTYWKRLIAAEETGSAYRPRLVYTSHRPAATAVSPNNVPTGSRTVTWSYSDPVGHAQTTYAAQVFNSATPDASTLIGQSGEVASAATSWTIPTSVTLTTGTSYWWRVKVRDGHGWSFWTATTPFTWDAVAPALNFDTPASGIGPATITSAAYTVGFDATDPVAGFGGANGWTLRRQIAPWSGSACGVFIDDPATDAVATGTTSALNQTRAQTLPSGSCYRWTLAATDLAGNTATTITSGTVRRDTANLLGLQRHHRLETWDLGAGDGLAVNVATGNVTLSHPVVSLPIRGSTVSLSLTYNSQDGATVGLGPGFRLNVQRRLTLNGDGTVTLTDADGARHTFIAPSTAGTVTTYTRPATLYAALVKDTAVGSNEFVLTYRDQSRDKFDILGSEAILVREEDRFGNGVTLAYAAGTARISTITDTAGSRAITFAWDASNRVTSITDWAWISGGVVQAGATGAQRTYRFFYDASSRLAGWSDPLNTAGTCPTTATHLTCLVYAGGLVTAVRKVQTVSALSGGSLTTIVRNPIETQIAYAGGDVTAVKDAEQSATGSSGTTFTRPASGQTKVVRPGNATLSPATETTYGLVTASDALARVQSVWRKLGTSQIEQRTTWNVTYPTEPASVTDNYGAVLSAPARTVSYTYLASSMGLLSRLTEPLDATNNRTTDFLYNANNDVTQRTVALNAGATKTITRFCYSADCSTTGLGLALLTLIENYKDGAPGGTSGNAEDVTASYQSDAFGQRTRETRSNYAAGDTLRDSRAVAFEYDANGNLTKEVTNYANGTVTSPGDDVNPNTTTNARTDLTTVHTYDTAGNRVSSADPRRAIELAVGTSLDADDYVARSTFDALNRQLTDEAPRSPGDTSAPGVSTTAYDELGGTRTTTDFGGLVTATEYDRAGRATRTLEDSDDAGPATAAIVSVITYDASGRTLTAKDRRQVADATLGATTTAYDELGQVTDTTDASGSTPDVATVTHRSYDGLDRAITEETGYGTGSGQLTEYSYDLGGRVTSTDDEFTCATATYDYRDLAATETSGLVGGTCASGAATRTVTHTHDGLGRRTRSEVTAGPDLGDRTLDATLDAAGNRLTSGVRTGGVTSTTTFTINPLDQVTVEARPDGSTAKTNYDPAGNPTDRCYWKPAITVGACQSADLLPWTNQPTVLTTSAYDGRNQRVTLVDAAAGTTTTYDPDHNYQPKGLFLATGSGREHQTLYAYDARHRLTEVKHQYCAAPGAGHSCASPAVTGQSAYGYDDADNRTSVTENPTGSGGTVRNYCYDALSRLRARQSSAACTTTTGDETATYDDAGNRLAFVAGGATTNQAYSASGQLCDVETNVAASCTGGNVGHDSDGNVTTYGGWTYAYDAEGRLTTAVETATNDQLDLSYDGEGHRTKIAEYTAGTLTRTRELRYQGDAVVEEKVADAAHPGGAVVRSYVTDEAGRIVKLVIPAGETGAGDYLVAWNGHGDALALQRINGDGSLTLANSYTYSTWGTPATATHNGIADLGFRYLYVGEYGVQWDDFSGLGLHYMSARHYSPRVGRFLQPDPSAAEANLYGYAEGNPVSKVDPSGTESVFDGAVARLNSFEKQLCNRDRFQCARVLYTSKRAADIAAQRYPHSLHLGKGDAFRHCVWQCLLTYNYGWDVAVAWGTAHERGDYQNVLHPLWLKMDLHNNRIGRAFGIEMRKYLHWSHTQTAIDLCTHALNHGWLRIVKRARTGGEYLTYSNR